MRVPTRRHALSDEGFSHPIARPKKLRGKRFRPCKDGEQVPACESGSCTLRGMKC